MGNLSPGWRRYKTGLCFLDLFSSQVGTVPLGPSLKNPDTLPPAFSVPQRKNAGPANPPGPGAGARSPGVPWGPDPAALPHQRHPLSNLAPCLHGDSASPGFLGWSGYLTGQSSENIFLMCGQKLPLPVPRAAPVFSPLPAPPWQLYPTDPVLSAPPPNGCVS